MAARPRALAGPAQALSRPLPRSFYARPSLEVAPDLLGRLLVRRLPEGILAGRIVECEAYQEDDPASHSFRGLTERTAVMFGPPGRLYVYFTYGMHFCMNVVTGGDGEGSAVLLRAVEPTEGVEIMRERRAVSDLRSLCAGPGRLTQAYGITRTDNGMDLVTDGDLFVAEGQRTDKERIGAGRRVGISVAVDRPWRFYVEGSPFLSKGSSPKRSGRPIGPEPRAKATEKGKAGPSGKAKAWERGSVGEGSRMPPSA
jgi:DNA-3-methyladenine glycosylase